MNVERSAPRGAVFLSYASQDAEAAKRICEALRAAGIEVWFDQSELVGGDAWDQKIRKQIKDCALLIPIISASTNARAEGYFRLEWRLADQRTHLMGRNKAFLLPVSIDGTTEADADVPDSFVAVQWTRLRQGYGGQAMEEAALAAFCARVKKILSGEVAESRGQRSEVGTQAPEPGTQNLDRSPRWLVPMFAGLALLAVLAVWQPWRRAAPPASPASAALSESQKNTTKARAIMENGDDSNHDTFFLAEELLKKAVAADVADGEAWAAYAQLSVEMYRFGFDRTTARVEAMRSQSERALSLAPDSIDAQLAAVAAGDYLGVGNEAGETQLRELIKREPDNVRLLQALGRKLGRAGKVDEALIFLSRTAELAPANPAPWADAGAYLLAAGRYAEAEAAVVKALARRTNGRALSWDIILKTCWHGGVAGVDVEQWPSWLLLEDRGANLAGLAWIFARQPAKALAIYQRIPRDYLHDTFFTGPRAALTAIAHEQAGHAEAARADWQLTLQLADRELVGVPGDGHALYWKAWAQARLGQTAAGDIIRRELQQRGWAPASYNAPQANMAGLALALGHPDEALALLRQRLEDERSGPAVVFKNGVVNYRLTRAILQLNPMFDSLRADERFQKLLAEAPAPAGPGSQPGLRSLGEGGNPDPGSANPASPNSKSIAVLPFASLSTDKENEFFADGVHDDVITNLAKIRDLKVISRTSVLAYRDTASRNLKKIAAELGVANVLEGSVRRAGNKVRVTAQLIDARTDAHLWAETFDGDASDIFALQADLAQKIAAQLKATLTANEKILIERHPTENAEAYESYLRGRVLEERLTQNSRLESYEEAIRAYQQAATLDPAFALAYARLARLHGTVYWFGYLDPSPARKALVEAAVDAAQRNAPDAPETHFARGLLEYFVRTNWERALAEYRLAEAGLPNDIQLQYVIAFSLRRLGRWPEALEYMERSLSRGPRDLYVASQIGSYYRALRRYDSAIEAGRRCVALFPQDSVARTILVQAQFEKDNDLPAYLQGLARVPPAENDPHGLQAAYQLALLSGDLAAADRALADPRLTGITDPWIAVLNEPVALHRARVAWLRGDAVAAKRFAEEAIKEFSSRAWTSRQSAYVAVILLEAKAYAGRGDEVIRELPGVLADALRRDAYGSRVCYEYAGQAYLVLGRREDALAMLRPLMGGPCFKSPNTLRIDPFWSRLKDDPRFEEILKSAKPL